MKYKKIVQTVTGIGFGFLAGLGAERSFRDGLKAVEKPAFNKRMCTGTECPVTGWDADWDHLKSKSVKTGPQRERNIILINHGQYEINKKVDDEKTLTHTGRMQVQAAVYRLKQLNLPYSAVLRSSQLQRAKETAEIIKDAMGFPEVTYDSGLNEGIPAQCIPPVPNWNYDDAVLHVDSQRIETTFRDIFRRLRRDKGPTFEIIVCHANIIRFFLCRALQFPPEAWLRFSIPHGSITWITIHGNGTVSARCVGEHTFQSQEMRSF